MWFSVRHLLYAAPPDAEGVASYEERVTVWDADDFDAAYAFARSEAEHHAKAFRAASVLPLFHVFRLFEDPTSTFPGPTTAEIFSLAGHGAELFSLMRDSKLDPETFVETFISLGAELETGRTRTFED